MLCFRDKLVFFRFVMASNKGSVDAEGLDGGRDVGTDEDVAVATDAGVTDAVVDIAGLPVLISAVFDRSPLLCLLCAGAASAPPFITLPFLSLFSPPLICACFLAALLPLLRALFSRRVGLFRCRIRDARSISIWLVVVFMDSRLDRKMLG